MLACPVRRGGWGGGDAGASGLQAAQRRQQGLGVKRLRQGADAWAACRRRWATSRRCCTSRGCLSAAPTALGCQKPAQGADTRAARRRRWATSRRRCMSRGTLSATRRTASRRPSLQTRRRSRCRGARALQTEAAACAPRHLQAERPWRRVRAPRQSPTGREVNSARDGAVGSLWTVVSVRQHVPCKPAAARGPCRCVFLTSADALARARGGRQSGSARTALSWQHMLPQSTQWALPSVGWPLMPLVVALS